MSAPPGVSAATVVRHSVRLVAVPYCVSLDTSAAEYRMGHPLRWYAPPGIRRTTARALITAVQRAEDYRRCPGCALLELVSWGYIRCRTMVRTYPNRCAAITDPLQLLAVVCLPSSSTALHPVYPSHRQSTRTSRRRFLSPEGRAELAGRSRRRSGVFASFPARASRTSQ